MTFSILGSVHTELSDSYDFFIANSFAKEWVGMPFLSVSDAVSDANMYMSHFSYSCKTEGEK